MSKYGVFSGPNTGKNGPEKIPYLDTFHAVTLYRERQEPLGRMNRLEIMMSIKYNKKQKTKLYKHI